MIKLIGDYHTHTIYSSGFKIRGSHAKGTIRENAQAALSKGLKEIAITEHGPSHYLYGLREKRIPYVKEEIIKLNEEFIPKGLKILMGIEANLIDVEGNIDINEKSLKYIDFLIMGYHYGIIPKGFKSISNFYILNPATKIFRIGRVKAIDRNTKAYIKSLNKYPIDMISHPGSKININIREVAEEAKKNKTSLEISSKHSQLSVKNIRKLLDIDVDYMINSDAHCSEDVGNISNGVEKAIEAKLPLEKIKNIEII